MTKTVLVTDSLFIFDEHVEQLKAADIEIVRLDMPEATEAELIEAVKGKQGYILGGIEKVTDNVIAAADVLEAICFTGADYHYFVPGTDAATKNGIAITNCPGANANAVAEYAFTLMLVMVREVFDLGRTGDKDFKTTNSLLDLHVGLVGMGHIGERVARMLKGFGVKNASYYNRTRKAQLEQELGINYLPLDELLDSCELVSLHTSKEAGEHYFGKEQLALMKDGAVIINTSFETAIDFDALYDELASGRIRAAHDGTVEQQRYKELPLGVWYNSKHTAFNTHEANKVASDIATQSIINLLSGNDDQYVVNPDYKDNR